MKLDNAHIVIILFVLKTNCLRKQSVSKIDATHEFTFINGKFLKNWKNKQTGEKKIMFRY